MKHYMCFDIGGTSVKFGVAGENGTLLQKNEIPNVITQKGVDGLVESLASVTERYRQEYDLRGIAVSTAGVVDPEKGLILYAPKYFPGYPGTALGERLEKCCNLPCTVENDVNAAALGEYWLGAGQGAKSMFCITVGTGIGGCALLDERVIHGAACFGGEAGLQHITPDSTWEEMASTRALIRNVAAAKGIPETALDGNICYILNPERIIVGGGIAAQEAYLYPLLDTALRKKLFPLVYEKLTLRFAALQNDAGMLGALYNLLQRQ